MGDMTKFNSAIEYYIFNVLLMCLLISEIFIFFYTRSKQNRTEKIDTRDLGTKWLLYLNFVFCLIISFLCISQKAPFCIRELTLPAYFAKIGMLITAVGICIRIKAVLTLKKAFTLNVQIKDTYYYRCKKVWLRRQSTSKDRIASACRQRHSVP